MPADMTEAIVIVFDVGSFDDSNEFAQAKKCLIKILLRKIMAYSKDVVSVIIAGSENTDINLKNELGYQNIKVLWQLMKVDSSSVKELLKIQHTGIVTSLFDAIDVAIQMLRVKKEEVANYKKIKAQISTYKIVLISTCKDNLNEAKADAVVDDLQKEDIELIIIGPNIFHDCNVENSNETASSQNLKEDLTVSQKLMINIYNELSGTSTLTSFDDAFEHLKYFSESTKGRSPWNVEMAIGNNIKIPICGIKMLSDDNKPIDWKTLSFQSSTTNQYPVIQKTEDVTPGHSSSHNSNITNSTMPSNEETIETQAVRKDKSFHVRDEEVNQSDIISGYLFGTTVVPMPNEDLEACKYHSGARGLKVLFTVPSVEIPKQYLVGESPLFITGNKTNPTAQTAISAFAKALHEANKVAVARKVYRENSSVTIGALYPVMNFESPALVFIELPYKRSINKLWFPSLSKVQVTDEQLSAVDKLIDDMDLTICADEDEEEHYEPETLLDPYMQYMYHTISEKLLQGKEIKENSLFDKNSEIPEYINNLITPLQTVSEKSTESIKRIANIFPLEVSKRKSKRNSLGDINGSKIDPEISIKKEIESSLDRDLPDLFLSPISSVGTVNPVSDFKTLLERGEPFEKVCNQLQNVIVELVRRAQNEQVLIKPLSSLEILRRSCISNKCPDLYNNWIKSLKDVVLEINQRVFWDRFTEDELGLIMNTELSISNVSNEENDEFLKYEDQKKQSSNNSETDFNDMLMDL